MSEVSIHDQLAELLYACGKAEGHGGEVMHTLEWTEVERKRGEEGQIESFQ